MKNPFGKSENRGEEDSMTAQLLKLAGTLLPGLMQQIFSEQDRSRAIRTLEDDIGYLFSLQKESRKRYFFLLVLSVILILWNISITAYLIYLYQN